LDPHQVQVVRRLLTPGDEGEPDPRPPLASVSAATVTEGGATAGAAEGRAGAETLFHFTVSLSAASEKEVTVGFATADGTARGADRDYYAVSGTVRFAPGQTQATLTILVWGDKRKEGDEHFAVNLFNAGNAVIGDGRAVGTILDDDHGRLTNSHGTRLLKSR
jgi:chitinase